MPDKSIGVYSVFSVQVCDRFIFTQKEFIVFRKNCIYRVHVPAVQSNVHLSWYKHIRGPFVHHVGNAILNINEMKKVDKI